jgi:hypothetical protein
VGKIDHADDEPMPTNFQVADAASGTAAAKPEAPVVPVPVPV